MTTAREGRVGEHAMNKNLKSLLSAISRYVKIKEAYNIAYSTYNGYSWDYHGRNFIESLEQAEKDVEKELEKYVDGRIMQVLKRKENKK